MSGAMAHAHIHASTHSYEDFAQEQARLGKKASRAAKAGWQWQQKPVHVSEQLTGIHRSIALALEHRVSETRSGVVQSPGGLESLVEREAIPECPDLPEMMALFDQERGGDSESIETSRRLTSQTSRDIRRLERKFRAHVSATLQDPSRRGRLRAHYRAHALAMEAGFILDFDRAIELACKYPRGGLSLLVDAEGVPNKRARTYVDSVHRRLRSLDPKYSRRRQMADLVSSVDEVGDMDSLSRLWTDAGGPEFSVYSDRSPKGAHMAELVHRHMRERAEGRESSISEEQAFQLLDYMQIKAAQFLDGGVETSDVVVAGEIGSDQQLIQYVEDRYYGILRATQNIRSGAPLLDHLVKLQASLGRDVGISKRCAQMIRGNTNGSRMVLHSFADRSETQHGGNHQAAFTWSLANLDRIPLDPPKRYTTRKVYTAGVLSYDELLWKANGRNQIRLEKRSMSFDHEVRIILHALLEYGSLTAAAEVTGIPVMRVRRKVVGLQRFAEELHGSVVPEEQWPLWDIELPDQIRHLLAHGVLRYTGRIFLLGEAMFPLMEPVRAAYDQLMARIEEEREEFHDPDDVTVIEKRHAYRRRTVENLWRAVWFRHLAFQRYHRDRWRYQNWLQRRPKSRDWSRRDRLEDNLISERNSYQMGLILTIQGYVRSSGDPHYVGRVYQHQYGRSGWLRAHMAYRRYATLIPEASFRANYEATWFPEVLRAAVGWLRGPPNGAVSEIQEYGEDRPLPCAA